MPPSSVLPARPACPVHSARPSCAKPPPATPPSSEISFENYLVGIPGVPVHGTSSASVGLLLGWRSEIIAAQTEYLSAGAALTAAKVAEEAAKATARVAGARCEEAGKRCHLAWTTYTGLVGDVCADSMGSLGGHAEKGKGKARTSSRSLEGEAEVIDLDALGPASDAGDDDVVME